MHALNRVGPALDYPSTLRASNNNTAPGTDAFDLTFRPNAAAIIPLVDGESACASLGDHLQTLPNGAQVLYAQYFTIPAKQNARNVAVEVYCNGQIQTGNVELSCFLAEVGSIPGAVMGLNSVLSQPIFFGQRERGDDAINVPRTFDGRLDVLLDTGKIYAVGIRLANVSGATVALNRPMLTCCYRTLDAQVTQQIYDPQR